MTDTSLVEVGQRSKLYPEFTAEIDAHNCTAKEIATEINGA